jgi:hypothetical protein
VRRNETSEITPRGWEKPPIRFFATFDGELAADPSVHLPDQRGGEVHVRHTAHVAAGHPAAQVDHHATAEGDDHVAARELSAGQPVEQVHRLRQRLVALAGRDRDHLGLDAGVGEPAQERLAVQLGHAPVRDHGHVGVTDQLEQVLQRLRQRPGDRDRVRVVARRSALDRRAGRRQADRVARMELIAAEQLCGHGPRVWARSRTRDIVRTAPSANAALRAIAGGDRAGQRVGVEQVGR